MKDHDVIQFDETNGDWRVTGTYADKDNIVFYHKNEPFLIITYPSYKIWNIEAHFNDYIPELEAKLKANTEVTTAATDNPEASTEAERNAPDAR